MANTEEKTSRWIGVATRESLSIATLGAASAIAVFAISLRWFVVPDGQVIQLLLIAASVTASLLILERCQTDSRIQRGASWLFALLSIAAFWFWSPGFAFSIMVSAPVLLSVTGIEWLKQSGYQLKLVDTRAAAPVVDVNEHEVALDDVSIHAENPAASVTHASAIEDPWLAVQQQFQSDASLIQNIARWQGPEGNRCVVANLRCCFTSATETCIIHLPFWPLLERDPEVFCRVASGPEATIKTTQQTPHGLRLEVRLNDRVTELPEPTDVIIEVVASVEAASAEFAA